MKRKKSKIILVREPNGRASRAGELREYPPAQVRRLRDAALAGMADPEWGTIPGRMFLAGKIDAAQYAAAKRWSERVAKYQQAINAPQPNPKALQFESGARGHDPDPASEEGRQRVAKDEAAIGQFNEAHAVLCGAGMISEAVVRNTCERDHWPVGQIEVEALNRGLLWLAEYWHLTNRGK